MESFGAMIEATLALFQIEFTIFDFTFSLWQVFLFSIAAGIVGFILREVLLGE